MVTEVMFCTNEYADNPEAIFIDITPEDCDKLAKATDILRQNKDLVSIRVEVDSPYQFLRDKDLEDQYLLDDENTLEWKIGVANYIVYPDSVYLYFQDGYDSRIQIETDALKIGFEIEELYD